MPRRLPAKDLEFQEAEATVRHKRLFALFGLQNSYCHILWDVEESVGHTFIEHNFI